MSMSRRRFVASGTALAATTTMRLPQALASEPTVAAQATPPFEVIALNRCAYGPRPGDLARVRSLGLEAYVDEQLNPQAIDDSACTTLLAATKLRLTYAAATDGSFPARDELLPLSSLAMTVPELWPRANFGMPMAWQERVRPFDEARVATWLRAVHSKRQLHEVLAEFWHNHFNVNATAGAEIACSFPTYDRDVIRTHTLGNFRQLLEAVAKSTAMMYYLDNVSNRISGGEGGNENFTRELFELHTLSSDNYFKFYDDRRSVGTITYGGTTYARGYIDEDVYEAANCFSGWTVANGHWERPTQNDGTFLYDPSWHYTGRKTVLSTDGLPNVDRNQADLRDGQQVLDLLAGHPGTARHLCTKLCRRLLSDVPPTSVVDAAVAVWMANRTAPDQIKKVVRTILLSPEFVATWGAKVKRPFESLASYLRATGATMPVDGLGKDENHWQQFFYAVAGSGQQIFEWPTPTGHPDLANYWASTSGMLSRWSLPFVVKEWAGKVLIDIAGQTNLAQSCTAIVDRWIAKLCGRPISAATRAELIAFLAQGGKADQPPQPTKQAPDWGSQEGLQDRVASMVQLLVISPDFHER